jgi:hypothetical protein
MICEKFKALPHMDAQDYISELLHSVKSDNELFEAGRQIIARAKEMGLFDKVKFRPDITNKEKPDTSHPQKDI